jgi:hypothetical protein
VRDDECPQHFCPGINAVIVGGEIVYRDGQDTRVRAGRLLRQRGGRVMWGARRGIPTATRRTKQEDTDEHL